MMNEKVWKDFWPTPKSVFDEMFSLVDWSRVSTVLEPSAGKGNLIHFLEDKWAEMRHTAWKSFRAPKIDAIELNPALRKQLQEDDISICGQDFLKFSSLAPYDLVFSNPPFANGDLHLLHAIDLMENWGGGQIVCLLNEETLKNPYSVSRQALAQKLEQYRAKIIALGPAFANAERSSNVNVSLIYIDIPRVSQESFLYEQYKEETIAKECYATPEELVEHGMIDAVCRLFENEVRLGFKLIEEFYAVTPYLQNEGNPYFTLKLNGSDKSVSKRAFVEAVRMKYWTRFFHNDEISQQLTTNLRTDYFNRVNTEYRHYDFNRINIATAHLEMSKNLVAGIKSTILALFDKLTHQYSWYPESKHNIHYFNGWRSNECGKVSEKVIIPLAGYRDLEFSWGGFKPSDYRVVEELADIEKCLAFFDGEYRAGKEAVEHALKTAESSGQTKNIPLKYFSVTFYKKGTCHIRFTDMEILKKFNVYAAQGKGWLPPSYGRKTYSEMDAEEKAVIDSFEGESSYEEGAAAAALSLDLESTFQALLPGASA